MNFEDYFCLLHLDLQGEMGRYDEKMFLFLLEEYALSSNSVLI